MLFILEDNIKPGNKGYDEARAILERIIIEKKSFINQRRTEDNQGIRDLEKIEREISQNLTRMDASF